MRKGGYKIVDFKGAELSSTVVVRPGIYSQIIDDYDKAILVSGVSLGGTLKDDSFASVSEVTGDNGDSVDLGVYGGLITVTEDDEVTFTLSSSPAELDAKIGDLDDLETTGKDSLVGAINEVNEGLTELIKIVSLSIGNTTITANGVFSVEKSYTIPDGYRAIGIISFDISRISGLYITGVTLVTNGVYIGGYNASSTTTINGNVIILCVKN